MLDKFESQDSTRLGEVGMMTTELTEVNGSPSVLTEKILSHELGLGHVELTPTSLDFYWQKN